MQIAANFYVILEMKLFGNYLHFLGSMMKFFVKQYFLTSISDWQIYELAGRGILEGYFIKANVHGMKE